MGNENHFIILIYNRLLTKDRGMKQCEYRLIGGPPDLYHQHPERELARFR